MTALHGKLLTSGNPMEAPGLPAFESERVTGADSPGVFDFVRILGNHKLLILAIMMASAVLGYLIALPQQPVYRAHTSIDVESSGENSLIKELDPGVTLNSRPELDVDMQARILRDDTFLEKAILRSRLGQSPDAVEIPGYISGVLQFLHIRKKPAAPRLDEVVRQAARHLEVQTNSQSRVIDVYYDALDPEIAANVLNAVSSALVDENLEARTRSFKRLGEALSSELQALKHNFESSANALQAYAQATGLMYEQEGGTDVAEQRLRQLQEELSRAQADRIAKQSRYEMALSNPPDSLPEVLDNPTLKDYTAKLSEMRRQLAELDAQFTPAYPKVRYLKAQISAVESAFEKERNGTVMRLSNDFDAAQRRERLALEAYNSQAKIVSDKAGNAIHYSVLKRDVDSNRALYELMLQKLKEAGIASAIRASNVRVISPSKPPARPYKPDPIFNSAMGLLAGLFLSGAFVLVREYADRTLKSPGDASATLNVIEIGAIPSAGRRLLGGAGLRRKDLDARAGANGLIRSRPSRFRDIELACWHSQSSLLAESFRSVLTSFWMLSESVGLRCCCVSSPSVREGKTTLISNLGIVLANAQRRVLIIDADTRKPQLHSIFGRTNSWGLKNVLEATFPIQTRELETLVVQTDMPGLYLMPAGIGEADIASLRYNPRLTELVQRMRTEFDMILIDTPPAGVFADARILARLCDGVLVVVRAGETTREQAAATLQQFRGDGTPVVGTILNDWNSKRTQAGYYGYRSSGTSG